jgi:Zn-dependent protease
MPLVHKGRCMKWSWKIGRVAGIGIYVHATFLLLLAWVAYTYWRTGQSLLATLEGLGFLLALFGCIVLHELGHALIARRFGIQTRDITLLPIGGLARLERMPDEPLQELWVALAGPAVNVAIAAVLLAWQIAAAPLEPLVSFTLTGGRFVAQLLAVNIFLVLFNMLPAFPMDGGRVLRALLATQLDYLRATQIAATVGQGFAFLFGFLGLFYLPLLLIAIFVWIGTAQEAGMTQVKVALGGIPVSGAMLRDFRTLTPHDSLARGCWTKHSKQPASRARRCS